MSRRRVAVEEKEPGLDISSLIDVCFLLLIYFIVTSTIDAEERDVNMALPSSTPSSSDQAPIDSLTIELDGEGIVYIVADGLKEPLDTNPEEKGVPLLTQRLTLYKQAAVAAGDQPVVQMNIDGEVEQQRVLDCLNALAKLGIDRVTFTDLIN